MINFCNIYVFLKLFSFFLSKISERLKYIRVFNYTVFLWTFYTKLFKNLGWDKTLVKHAIFCHGIFADTTVLYIRKSIKKVHPKWVNLVDVQKFTLSWLHTAQCTVLSVSLHTLYICIRVSEYVSIFNFSTFSYKGKLNYV